MQFEPSLGYLSLYAIRLCSGEWVDDMRNGFGSYYYVNGDVYKGNWLNHARHGSGEYTYAANGVVYTGTWERGRRVGGGNVTIMSKEALAKSLLVSSVYLGFFDCSLT